MAEEKLGALGLLDGEGETFIEKRKVVLGKEPPAQRDLSKQEIHIHQTGGRRLSRAERALLWKVRP